MKRGCDCPVRLRLGEGGHVVAGSGVGSCLRSVASLIAVTDQVSALASTAGSPGAPVPGGPAARTAEPGVFPLRHKHCVALRTMAALI